jgi:hypothetical protein
MRTSLPAGLAVGAAVGVWGLGAAVASGSVLDLTTPQSSGVINGAVFETQDFRSAGTGVLHSFVRVQASGTEQGYNTSGRPTAFDENSSPQFTHNLQVSDLPVVSIGGADYYEFSLDINQMSSGADSLLSLDQVQLFTSATGGLTTPDLGSVAQLRYSLDAGDDNWVRLDYNLGAGSGEGDMRMYIPASVLGGTASDFVYLYSQFGSHHASNAGFEEWAVRAVPSPSGALPLLLSAALLRRRR